MNEQPDEEKIEWMAERFFKSNYDIAKLIEDIFTSDWFYDEKNIGTKIKSPVELIVGLQRMLPMKINNDEALIVLQRLLGQVLFYPPNVAGWPGGKTWIDSGTLMMRMRIPGLVNEEDEINISPKNDDDQMMGRNDDTASSENKTNKYKKGKGARAINASVDWKQYVQVFENTPREKLLNAMAAVLLQTRSTVDLSIIKQYANEEDRHHFIRSATIQLMSTPEYQLC